ncbi:hypothetical protein SNE40_014157 [Patella caerulea]|uniref:SWIM-type domain-containing protein n=1 Tax=Patella caerulea TaxID=87958 RepID=A0AAN8JGG3_PATCE
MKKVKYNVVTVFFANGDVKYAACDCPVGIGINAEGKCNHAGGLLFCVEDFCQKGFHEESEPLTCTSKLNQWIVPRKLNVESSSLKYMNIRKHRHGNDNDRVSTVSSYDPRAPNDRTRDIHAFCTLYEDLEHSFLHSGFFLFHSRPDDSQCHLQTEESIPVAEYVNVYTEQNNLVPLYSNTNRKHILDNISLKKKMHNVIADNESQEMEIAVNMYMKNDVSNLNLHENIISAIELETRKQSQSDIWCSLHDIVLTSSNFGRAAKCSKNPDNVLRAILYSDISGLNAVKYGRENEEKAIKSYIEKMEQNNTPVTVEKCGIILHSEIPGLGASPDGKVYDTVCNKFGGLEVKCPISKAGMTIEQACQQKGFYLANDNGNIHLKISHDYFYQVQGQMFISGLERGQIL